MSTPTEQHDERIRLGLLEYTMRHAVEDDYARVAERDGAEPQSARRLGTWAAMALLLFGLLVVVASSQTSRTAAADEAGRRELIAQINEARDQLGARRSAIAELTAGNAKLQEEFLSGNAATSGVRSQLRTLTLLSGATEVTGSGVRLTVNDGTPTANGDGHVLDKDLQRVVNGLWEAGAEAIAINGQRLTGRTAIRHAGSAITVNYTSLSAPYVVAAIGNPDTLPSRFAQTVSGASFMAVQKHFNMPFQIKTETRLRLPAADVEALRSARPRKDGAR